MILNIINEIKNNPSTNAKIDILKDNKDVPLFSKILFLAYDKQTRFHVKKFNKTHSKNTDIKLEYALNVLENQLAKRIITGNAAIEKVEQIYSGLNNNDKRVLELILNKDLDCGISAVTINKVFPNLIKEQPCCTAQENSEENLNKIKMPAISQLKVDGSRNFIPYDSEGEFDMLSRQANSYTGLTDLEKSLKELKLKDEVLDGELIYMDDISKGLLEDIIDNQQGRASNNGILNKTIQGTITEEEQKHIVYVVWDIIPYDVYYGNKPSVQTYRERLMRLQELSKRFPNNIKLIPSKEVNTLEEAKEIAKSYISMKLEGSVLKNANSIWENTRISGQVKIKDKNTIDLKIIDVYPHKKNPNMIGGLTAQTEDGLLVVNIGSGFVMKDYEVVNKKKVFLPVENRAENDRSYLWSIREKLIGSIIEVEFEKIVSNKKNNIKSLTHPIFKKIRFDKEIANYLEQVITLIEVKNKLPHDFDINKLVSPIKSLDNDHDNIEKTINKNNIKTPKLHI